VTLRKIHLLGTPIHAVTEAEVVRIVEDAIRKGESIRIGVVNAAKLVAMQKDERLYRDVTSSDLVLADGMSVVWASRLLGGPLPERVTGIDLMFRLFELADRLGLRVFCLGATEEVSTKVAQKLSADYPGLELAGRCSGYFTREEEPGIAATIHDSRTQILLVAMTSPKKEAFMARWGDTLNVEVIHGVGGSFDVYAGTVKRAPAMWSRLGLEWLYRVKQEPRRLWKRYAVTNTQFCWLVAMEAIRRLTRALGAWRRR
jgi:N-acetylglucosaminyldiphosphoundecaprenol N-acetyl-beta-D-mannosaminyltransferase